MDLRDALIGLQRTSLHGVPDRILVLPQELSDRDIHRHEYRSLTVLGRSICQLVHNLLVRLPINAAPLTLSPITDLPASIRYLAGTTTFPVCVLLRHERELLSLCPWSDVGVRVGVNCVPMSVKPP